MARLVIAIRAFFSILRAWTVWKERGGNKRGMTKHFELSKTLRGIKARIPKRCRAWPVVIMSGKGEKREKRRRKFLESSVFWGLDSYLRVGEGVRWARKKDGEEGSFAPWRAFESQSGLVVLPFFFKDSVCDFV